MSTSEAPISPERALWLRRQRAQRLAVRAAKVGLLIGLVALWELAANLGWIDPFITSQPSRVLRTINNLWQRGDLWGHVGITTGEAVAGFLLGTILGTLIAVALWCSNFLCRVLEPYLVVLNALPKIALGPIFILWIGAGPLSIIVIALSISLVVSTLEVLNGFLATDPEMIRLVRTFGAGRWEILRRVVFPANIPTIIGSLKINVGMSWVGVIVGEFLISKAGLGYLIVYGSQVFQLDLVMASVVILSIVATLMYESTLVTTHVLIRFYHGFTTAHGVPSPTPPAGLIPLGHPAPRALCLLPRVFFYFSEFYSTVSHCHNAVLFHLFRIPVIRNACIDSLPSSCATILGGFNNRAYMLSDKLHIKNRHFLKL